jgi:hypothetical protein
MGGNNGIPERNLECYCIIFYAEVTLPLRSLASYSTLQGNLPFMKPCYSRTDSAATNGSFGSCSHNTQLVIRQPDLKAIR